MEIDDQVAKVEILKTALLKIAGGDAYHDGAARFMGIACEALDALNALEKRF